MKTKILLAFFVMFLIGVKAQRQPVCGHAHVSLGWWMSSHDKVNGQRAIKLIYGCPNGQDTVIRTTVDSVVFYVSYMRSTMPRGFVEQQ